MRRHARFRRRSSATKLAVCVCVLMYACMYVCVYMYVLREKARTFLSKEFGDKVGGLYVCIYMYIHAHHMNTHGV